MEPHLFVQLGFESPSTPQHPDFPSKLAGPAHKRISSGRLDHARDGADYAFKIGNLHGQLLAA
ncbi:MAG TPA: hypothetical protein VFN20_08180, partial [Candidatus Acidoferrum sp.]|nr:hypothetical protein [Candidatus Acidoferrum sp.]